jgi:hypothetical protein
MLFPLAGHWGGHCCTAGFSPSAVQLRRARWPGHKPIRADRPRADLRIDCCTQLDQPKSRLYAARALSAESPQQRAVVAYSRDFGLRPGQAVNRVPAGSCQLFNTAPLCSGRLRPHSSGLLAGSIKQAAKVNGGEPDSADQARRPESLPCHRGDLGESIYM